jgi:hypothetical protein
VRNFGYLGCSVNCGSDDDVNATADFKSSVGRSHTCALYGSNCWTLTKEMRRIEPAEMRFVRAATGYRMAYRKLNEDIKEQLGITDINPILKDLLQEMASILLVLITGQCLYKTCSV